MTITFGSDFDPVDWQALKATLAADHFDNGRSPEQLERSFRNSYSACFAWRNREIVGTARVLSDGVCNAYLIDIWTLSKFRRRGIAREMVERVCSHLTGQHVYLQADIDLAEFYHKLGFREQPAGMSRLVGRWLNSDP